MFAAFRARVTCVLVGTALAWSAACGHGQKEPQGPRLVVLYATCSLSRHHIGPYNPAVSYTPALSDFAREATVFSRHHTEAGQSGLAFASILSGTQADQHGVYRHPSWLGDEAHLIAESFAEQGYDTHFWSGHRMAAADLNYAQGVRPANIHARDGQGDEAMLTANDVEFAGILDRLKTDPSYRAFVQVLFTVTHAPYTRIVEEDLERFRRTFPDEWPDLTDEQAARFERNYRRQRRRLERDFPATVRRRGWAKDHVEGLASFLEGYYKANVHVLDTWFGRFIGSIREAGLLDESLIAFTTDHGETLDREHTLFKWSHGLEVSPDVIQVPLIVRLPGRRGLPVYPGVSRSIDVHRTLLGLAGLPLEAGDRVAGKDLSAAVLGREPAPSLRAFSHTMPLTPQLVESFRGRLVSRFHPSTDVRLMWTAVRDRDTYVRRRRSAEGQWSTEAFDLGADPGGARDVFDPDNAFHRELEAELEHYKARLVESHVAPENDRRVDDDVVAERLRAMGYIE